MILLKRKISNKAHKTLQNLLKNKTNSPFVSGDSIANLTDLRIKNLEKIEVNKIEASSSSVFVSGWRPAIGWIGVAAMAYQFLLYPLFQWAWKYLQAMGWVPTGMDPPPVLEADQLWVILSGILGIAGMRSFEKTKGVASK